MIFGYLINWPSTASFFASLGEPALLIGEDFKFLINIVGYFAVGVAIVLIIINAIANLRWHRSETYKWWSKKIGHKSDL